MELGFEDLCPWTCLRLGRKECFEGHFSPRGGWLGHLYPWNSEHPFPLIWKALGLSKRPGCN